MRAQSYGKYDVFDDETAQTWEQAEALALKARGQKVEVPPAPPEVFNPPKLVDLEKLKLDRPITLRDEPARVVGRPDILNRALILLIHLRERVFKDNPQVESWVDEILEEAHVAQAKDA